MNPNFMEFTYKWSQMFKNQQIDTIPWEDETNILSMMPFTAQIYDCVAILAQAATNWLNDGGSASTGITRSELIDALKDPDLQTPGIGNTDANNMFSFDTNEGGYDGFKSYEILNW